MTMSQELKRVFLFQNIDDSVLSNLGNRCNWRSFSGGQEMLGQFEDTDDVFFLLSGRARVIIHSVSGRAVAFRDIGPGEIFGELAAIDARPRAASVRALEPCRAASMSPLAFREVLTRHPVIAEAILRHLVTQVRTLTDRVVEYSTLPVKHRVHAELLRLASPPASDKPVALIDPVPTHEEIANRISTHRQAVTSEINRLARFGLIERHGRTLRINDIDRLGQMVADAGDERD